MLEADNAPSIFVMVMTDSYQPLHYRERHNLLLPCSLLTISDNPFLDLSLKTIYVDRWTRSWRSLKLLSGEDSGGY